MWEKGWGPTGWRVLSLALPFVIVGGVISLLLGIGGCTILGIETGRRNERAGTELFSLCVSLGAIAGVLITAVGGWQNPDTSERALAEGRLDLVSMARAWISNPDYGELIYQEQVSRLVRDVGGFSLAEGVRLVKLISKKKVDVIHAMREKFMAGAAEKDALKKMPCVSGS